MPSFQTRLDGLGCARLHQGGFKVRPWYDLRQDPRRPGETGSCQWWRALSLDGQSVTGPGHHLEYPTSGRDGKWNSTWSAVDLEDALFGTAISVNHLLVSNVDARVSCASITAIKHGRSPRS